MKDIKGLVSVIVPVYNVECFLPHCIASLKSQTYQSLEILLIDDGSIDGSGRICDAFAATDSRVRVIHQKNSGVWAVRNRGLREAKGEYVVFPDGDDYFHKDYIRLLYEAINLGGKEYPVAICGYRRPLDYDQDTESDMSPCFEEIDQKVLLTLATCFPSCGSALWGANWNHLYRKAFLPEMFQMNYPRCQDYDSNLRFYFKVDRAIFVHMDLYYWVRRSGQLTSSLDNWLIGGESRCRIFYDNYTRVPKDFSNYRANLLSNLYREMLSWVEKASGTAEKSHVSKIVSKFEKKTLLSLLFCRQIPFRRKLRWLFSLHAPSFAAKVLVGNQSEVCQS